MSQPSPHAPDVSEPPDDDGYSPVFTAWALLLTVVVLALLVAALWALRMP